MYVIFEAKSAQENYQVGNFSDPWPEGFYSFCELVIV